MFHSRKANGRVTADTSDKEFNDGRRVEEVAKPMSANSVRLPVRDHRSCFGFGSLSPSKTAIAL